MSIVDGSITNPGHPQIFNPEVKPRRHGTLQTAACQTLEARFESLNLTQKNLWRSMKIYDDTYTVSYIHTHIITYIYICVCHHVWTLLGRSWSFRQILLLAFKHCQKAQLGSPGSQTVQPESVVLLITEAWPKKRGCPPKTLDGFMENPIEIWRIYDDLWWVPP